MSDATTVTEDARVSVRGRDDHQTVDESSGARLGAIDGVEVKPIRPHVDQRGSLAEVINFADPFWREPIVYCYTMTVKPGRIKGWGMHLRQVDRHVLHTGEARLVLFDAREDSPTHGVLQTVHMSDEAKAAVRIPAGVWHALQNTGATVMHVTNFPTIPYDRANPDKQLLEIGSPQIPFDFGDLDSYGR